MRMSKKKKKRHSGATKFFDVFSSMISEVKHEATKGKGIKILTAKQMLQRLPIALTQVKKQVITLKIY